ncbi:unnamed protein product [Heterobilharzia americana]|nr:unnamed protein product [Heterobilharzia americana]
MTTAQDVNNEDFFLHPSLVVSYILRNFRFSCIDRYLDFKGEQVYSNEEFLFGDFISQIYTFFQCKDLIVKNGLSSMAGNTNILMGVKPVSYCLVVSADRILSIIFAIWQPS